MDHVMSRSTVGTCVQGKGVWKRGWGSVRAVLGAEQCISGCILRVGGGDSGG